MIVTVRYLLLLLLMLLLQPRLTVQCKHTSPIPRNTAKHCITQMQYHHHRQHNVQYSLIPAQLLTSSDSCFAAPRRLLRVALLPSLSLSLPAAALRLPPAHP
jgi:hypothetical protein